MSATEMDHRAVMVTWTVMAYATAPVSLIHAMYVMVTGHHALMVSFVKTGPLTVPGNATARMSKTRAVFVMETTLVA